MECATDRCVRASDPELDYIRDNCTQRSFQRGYKHYADGKVTLVTCTTDKVKAVVEGVGKHTVDLAIDGEEYHMKCTCSDSNVEMCEHIVASMLLMHYEVMDVLQERQHEVEDGQELVTPDSMHRLGENAVPGNSTRHDPRQAKRLEDTDRHKNTRQHGRETLGSVIFLLEKMYEKAKGKTGMISNRNKVNFEKVDILARTFEDVGKRDDAIQTYKDTSEYISRNIKIVDNSKNHYTWAFLNAVNGITKRVKMHKMTLEEKQPYISYFFERYIQESTNDFAQIYLEKIKKWCKTGQDFEYFMDLINPYTDAPADTSTDGGVCRSRAELLEVKAFMLRASEDPSLGDFLALHCRISEKMYVKYIWHLKKHNAENVVRVAEEGHRLFPDSVTIRDILCDIYPNDDPRHARLMRRLFVSTCNWGYYDKVKDIVRSGWDVVLETILEEIKLGGNPHMRIDVLLREGMPKRALREAIDEGDIQVLDAYSQELGSEYPEEYFAEYEALLQGLAEAARNRDDYDDIKRHIVVMSKIPKHKKQFAKFLNGFKQKHVQISEFLE